MIGSSQRLVIVGAGGHCKVVLTTAQQGGWTVEAVLDDAQSKWGTTILGSRISGPIERGLADTDDGCACFVAVGDNRVRKKIAESRKGAWATLAHPRAIVHMTAEIDVGTLVCAGSVVQPEASIGRHAIVNTGAVVEHDVLVGDYAHVGPNSTLAGAVRIGCGAFIGSGAVVLPGISVGDWAIVGAGSVVTRNVPSRSVVMGVPARPKITGKQQ